MHALFSWDGQYAGFVSRGYLFDRLGTYRGWLEGNRAWSENGEYLGDLTEENYILRKDLGIPPIPRIPRIPPIPPIPPNPKSDRVGRLPRMGYTDVLQNWVNAGHGADL